jgi:hypothetical protein
MFRKYIYLILILLPLSGLASHLRSGEISYKPVPGQANTYEITVTVYTNASPSAQNDLVSVKLNPGDGTGVIQVERINGVAGKNSFGVWCAHLGELITPAIRKNIYVTTHTFDKDGSYIISISPSARNLGIINMPTGNLPMYVESMLTVSSSLTPMTSPQLSLPPIGDGCINATYKINPGAIDPDGDVLKFELTRCKTTALADEPPGFDIPGYKYPDELDASGRTIFTMNSKTGEILWDKPTIQGEYNISFKIEKWRNGVLIGYVTRDMQVTISPCDNIPPIINPVPDTCIEVGQTLVLKITSSDANKDTLTFTTTGLPYTLPTSPAIYTPDSSAPIGTTSGTFSWTTTYDHVAKTPYQVYYSVTDSHKGSHLTDYTSNFITVIAPSVKNVNAISYLNGFKVTWDQSICTQAIGYNIWRKTDAPTQTANNCTQGASDLGFSLVGTVNGNTTLSYIDSNDGHGLLTGLNYCYIITAVFPGGGEGHPSEPFCSTLMIPFIKVVKDTVTSCLNTVLPIDSTIIKFESDNPLTKYSWSSSPEIKLSSTDKPLITATLNNIGLYFIKIKATIGFYTDSATIYIRVNPIPEVKISLKDYGGEPDTVVYYNNSLNFARTEWKLPDGTKSSNKDSVLVQYDVNGYYRAYLTVYNDYGCPDTTSILHRVAIKGLSMPNAFQPESPHSEINTFKPSAIGLATFQMGIWDLWGNLVWESNKFDPSLPIEGWNGCDKKGKKLPSQVYIWRVKATFIDGTPWKGKKDHFGKYHTEGTLTLIR